MREIRFENTNTLDQVLLSDDALDPRSPNYTQKLIRPVIRWRKILLCTAVFLGGICSVYSLLITLNIAPAVAFYLCLVGALAVVLLFLKRIMICLVRIYQRFAPASVRNKCRFEPSCSQYMVLSLEKYGLWKGLNKGIDRLWRCHSQDGGFDNP